LNFSQSVVLELKELQKLGVPVSREALQTAGNEDDMEEYENMGTTEAADLLRTLYP
jgi:hypothetical protein